MPLAVLVQELYFCAVSQTIHVLPDHIANQIAAGEVIQRPASAVKELLENAIDAGATRIKLTIEDAGKALVQVSDNGKGMGAKDAALAFARHATSKISSIEDLFQIRTMGFRGEALASIAAVAQVNIKTRRADDAVGTELDLENSQVVRQDICALPIGTVISMKNLFFNVPARRNFLKSNAAEMRHITEEFIRVAMAYPHVFFSLQSNGQEVYHLEAGNQKQRVVQVLGNSYAAKLVPVQENTDYCLIEGFIGKPDTARKSRGDQYFFVNNRFIRSAYLHHAVQAAFSNLIGPEHFPSYVLYISLDPEHIDINVHPTKQEIKFEDERIMYAFVNAAVKHALAQFSLTPSLDFTLNPAIQELPAVQQPFADSAIAAARNSDLYKGFTQQHQAHAIGKTEGANLKNWQSFFDQPSPSDQVMEAGNSKDPLDDLLGLGRKKNAAALLTTSTPLQIAKTYLLVATGDGFVVIHQQLAHERVLYEQFGQAAHGQSTAAQALLYPKPIEWSAPDLALAAELVPELKALGYLMEKNKEGVWCLMAVPADLGDGDELSSLELLLEQYKHFTADASFSKREKLVRCRARQRAIKAGQALDSSEIMALAEALWACQTPNLSPNGQPTFMQFSESYLDGLFGR